MSEEIDFKLENLHKFFSECILDGDKGILDMDNYIKGYDEVYKFLCLLGTVFGWVASDVQTKLDILRGHREKGDTKDNYATVQLMIEYETKQGLINKKARESTTGKETNPRHVPYTEVFGSNGSVGDGHFVRYRGFRRYQIPK